MSEALTIFRHCAFHATPFAESKHQETLPLCPLDQTLSFNIASVWYAETERRG